MSRIFHPQPRCALAALVVAVLVGSGLTPMPATAYQYPTTTYTGTAGGTTATNAGPSGNQITISTSGLTSISSGGASGTIGQGGPQPGDYTPPIPDATPAVRIDTPAGGCGAGSVCARGTVTISFEHPVVDPIIHLSGLGGNTGGAGDYSSYAARLTLVSGASSMSVLSGTNFTIVGSTIRTSTVNVGTQCDTVNGVTGQRAGCGSVQLSGTISSVTFSVAIATFNGPGTAVPNGSDTYYLAVSTSEDFGDAPASYDAGNAARHIVSDIRLGAGVTADNTTVANSTTSPLSGATAATDSDDAFATLPPLPVDGTTPYTLEVPYSGASEAGELCGWIDFDQNGIFDPGERQCAPVAPGSGSVTLTWPAPTGLLSGSTYARFRIGYSDQVQSPTGAADSGEVEDYLVEFEAPAIELVKTVAPTSVATAGAVVTYTFVATNTGNVTLSDVTVTDPLPGMSALDCTPPAPGVLAPAEQMTCTATYTVTQTDVDNATVPNTATVVGTPPTADPVTDTDDAVVTIAATPAIDLVKSAVPLDELPAVDEDIEYTFVVTNTGNVTLNDVTVTDPLPGMSPLACTPPAPGVLAPNAQMTCTATYTVTQADVDNGSVANTATVTGTPPTGDPVTDSDSVTVPSTPAPAIDLVKSANPVTVSAAGELVTYTFEVTNIGNVTLTAVTITDPLPGLGPIDCGAGTNTVATLAPGQLATCTATYTVTQADVDTGTVLNTATATGTPPTGPDVADSDDAVVTITATPAIELVKSADPLTVADAGQLVTYTFDVTNTGDLTLTDVTVTDPLPGLGPIDCGAGTNTIATLAPGQMATCTATYTVTQADADNGEVVNQATATGTPPTGPDVTDSDDAVVAIPATPALTIDKSSMTATYTEAGEVIDYEFIVTNTGNVTLTGIAVNDALLDAPATCQLTTLTPGGSTSCTGSHTVTQADLDNGEVVNVATATGTPPDGTPIPSPPDTTTVPAAAAPAIDLVKSAEPLDELPPVGDDIDYTFVVTNTGNVTLTDVTVTDPLPGMTTLDCTPPAPSVLAPNEQMTCTASYTVTQADVDNGTVANTATATGTPPAGDPVTDTDTVTVPSTPAPAIELAKSVNPSSVSMAGQVVTYTFAVTNTGTVTLTDVEVSDPLPGLGPINCTPQTPATLAPGQVATCTATYMVTQTDADNGTVLNTATASGTPPTGPDVTDTDGAVVTITAAPAIDLVKSAEPLDELPPVGDDIDYTFVVTNTGNVTLTDVTVTDPLPGMTTLDCTPPAPSVLAPNEQMTCTASYTVTQADVDNGTVANTATAIGTPPAGDPVTDTDTVTVPSTPAPALTIDKASTTVAYTEAGDDIDYTFVVTNSGNVTLTDVTVSDPLPGMSALSCTPAAPSVLVPGQQMTCTATYTVTQTDVDNGTVANTATATGTPPTGPDVTDSDTVTVPSTSSPAIDLVKSVNPASVSDAGGVVTYTFAVTNIGNVTLSDVTVTDPLPGLGPIECTPAGPSVLAPDEEMICTATYTVTQSDVDAGTVLNTATATGTPPSGPDVADSDDAVVTITATPAIDLVKSAVPLDELPPVGDDIDYTFVVTNTGNVTLTDVTVTDPLPGMSALACTPPAPATLAPDAQMTCTATYTVTQADIDNGTVANTATAIGTPPTGDPVTDTDTVTVPSTPAPAIELAKSVNPTSVTEAGGVVTYTFAVTNIGNVTLTDVAVADPLPGLGPISCTPAAPATLIPGQIATCTATYTVTQTDVDNGTVANTATATGTPPTGPDVADSDDAIVTITAAPALTIDKSSPVATYAAVGDVIDYEFVVTNTGNVTLTGITVNDAQLDAPATCPVTTLAPDEFTTCAGAHTVTQADLDNGEVVNVATGSGTPPDGPPIDSPPDTVTVSAASNPAIDLVKSADPLDELPAVDEDIEYTFVVTNTGNVTLTDVGVSDPLPGMSALDCDPAAPSVLAPDEQMTCTATYTVTQADVDNGTVANTATAIGTPPTGDPVTDTDTVTVPSTPEPALSIDKSAADATYAAVGDVVDYQFRVTNTGNVTLTGITVNDAVLDAPASCPVTTLAPGVFTTCTGAHTVTQADLDNGEVVNVATGTGTPPDGPPIDSPPDTVTVPATSSPAIDLVKSVAPTSVATAGAVVTYTFVVTNIGNVTLTDVTVTDPLPGLGLIECTPPAPGVLAPDEEMICTASYTVTQADVDNGEVVNLATALGTPPTGDPVTDTDDAVVTITATPAIDLVKSADALDELPAVGEDIEYTFVVTNTGNVTLSDVMVSDPLPGLGPIGCDPASPGVLAPDEQMVCTAMYTVTQADVDNGTVANTATATGTPPTGDPVTDTDTVTVPSTPAPAIGLAKSVNPASVSTAGELVTYTFAVTNTGNVTLSDVTVADPLPGLGPIGCVPAAPATLAPGQMATCTATYTVTQADADTGTVFNTATTIGTPPTGGPVSDSDDAIVTIPAAPALTIDKSSSDATYAAVGDVIDYTFVVTNTGNVTLTGITVNDAQLDAPASCPVTTLAPDEFTTCTGAHTVTQADLDSGEIVNVATGTGTPPDGPPIDSPPDTITVPATTNPAVTIDKTVVPLAVSMAGEQVTYTFVVTNTGNVTLSDVGVSDPLPGLGPIGCTPAAPAVLAPGDDMTCTATYAVTQADVDNGSVLNTATTAGTPPSGDPVTDSDDAVVTITPAPAIDLVKSADPLAELPPLGGFVDYTFVVTNIGNVTLSDVGVFDPLPGMTALDCDPVAPGVLVPGQQMVCTATYTVTQTDVDNGTVVNTATATGTPPTGDPVTDTDTVTVPSTPEPALTIDKSSPDATYAAVGDVIDYTFVVTNTGNVTMTGIIVNDAQLDTPASCPATTLAPGQFTTCTGAHTVTQADLDAGEIVNVATATGTPPDGPPIDSPPDTITVPGTATPALSIDKSSPTVTYAAAGDVVDYTFVVTNTGNVTLTGITVNDPKIPTVTCPQTTLVPGALTTCTGSYTVTAADLDAGSLTNVATATGTPPTGPPVESPPDAVTIAGEQRPSLAVVKSTTTTEVTTVGQIIEFRFLVTNTGNVTMTGITVNDPKIPTVTCPQTTLAAGASTTCTGNYTVTQTDIAAGRVVNVASVTGTPPGGTPIPPESSNEVVVVVPPTPPPAPTTTPPPPPATPPTNPAATIPDPALPSTGGNTTGIVTIAALIALLGAALTVITRRRRHAA